ncbi:hypothetical protein KBY24_15430 [Ruegeria pomeroyi]|uniref:Uncharacterized protein n=1 Tax=Ruegeria alba TaxID=2916756 RepID=A0ABS9NX50_9RHOB|nr:hypothetical protein [Ruegeria alba]MCE8534779.1 hypothetical protein [Ruegeria pomeroyi]MCG6558807.1 hypothetical protein [Ruegeria alba]
MAHVRRGMGVYLPVGRGRIWAKTRISLPDFNFFPENKLSICFGWIKNLGFSIAPSVGDAKPHQIWQNRPNPAGFLVLVTGFEQ